jgi:hypothetical protein
MLFKPFSHSERLRMTGTDVTRLKAAITLIDKCQDIHILHRILSDIHVELKENALTVFMIYLYLLKFYFTPEFFYHGVYKIPFSF